MILPVEGQSQNFSLPTSILDSMIHEVRVGRTAVITVEKQKIEISRLETLVFNQANQVSLLKKKIASDSTLAVLSQQESALSVRQAQIQTEECMSEKQRIKKNRWMERGFFLAGIVVLLL